MDQVAGQALATFARLDAQRAPTAYARAAEKACGGLLPFATIATGSRQSAAGTVRDRHPDALAAILPIGPEFASPETFHPLSVPKDIDVICVAAAQGYKRHDIVFDALDALTRSIRALSVFGYGDDADALRQRTADLNLNIELVGPAGFSHREVNRLMNRARIGIVCGIDDGAPAILTEYMQAGLPVLANERLRGGMHYVRPETGRMASAMDFGTMLADL